MPLPSKYGRDALCVNIVTSGAPEANLRFVNMHLGSFDSLPWRNRKMGVLADLLHAALGFTGAISPEDDGLVNKYQLPTLNRLVREDVFSWSYWRHPVTMLKPANKGSGDEAKLTMQPSHRTDSLFAQTKNGFNRNLVPPSPFSMIRRRTLIIRCIICKLVHGSGNISRLYDESTGALSAE
ncbi:hypothetical protein CVT26_001443 [Gymnopilus dilepis]|uniref:Uncharacterized protein n=1 Tax=Gymnopilus dilepis TaxID=231916 RepID=A0A409WEE3_9AGAR|nr:hypothetical protein CVT26_001443 [Gymnopilus dilepis]